jgi:membrane fusion protein, copper/silver efflux system
MKLALPVLVVSMMYAPLAAAADLPKPLLDAYLQVQTDLAADKLETVSAQAGVIESGAAGLGADAAPIAAAAKKLQAVKDIAAARVAFGEVSEALIAYAEKTKTPLGDLRIAYCPMVNKRWLQKEASIRNPDYGSAMLTCGSFQTPK